MIEFETTNEKIESLDSFENLKQNLKINIHDLYFQGLLEEKEALTLLKKITESKNIDELRNIEREFLNSDANFVYTEGKMVDEFMGIERFKKNFDEILKDVDVSNWENRFTSLLNEVKHFDLHNYHEILIKAWLASFLEQVYMCHIKENIDIKVFGEKLIDILTELKPSLPDFLKISKGKELGKRKPSFIESVEGTLERFYKIKELTNLMEGLADSVIVGGSMSYGPFYNIRKLLDETGSSDIDLIVVAEENKFEENLWKKLKGSNIFTEEERNIFFGRMEEFKKLLGGGKADIFSQKFKAKGTDFDVSIHFFTPTILDSMIGDDFEEQLKKDEEEVVIMKDFRAKKFPYKTCLQQNFLGEKYKHQVSPQNEVSGGVIAELPSYIIHNGHFYLGLYQNLISPCFSVYYGGDKDTIKKIEKFRHILEQRVEKERKDKFNARFLKSHIRDKIFSPELFKRYCK